MTFLDRIDRIIRPIAVDYLPEILVVGQVATFILALADPTMPQRLVLIWSNVFQGEIWRLITFPFYPPPLGLLVIFYFMLFYFMSKTLENHWGTVRFNSFVYIGILFTMLGGLLAIDWPITGFYLQTTVFLAFATLYPNYELHVMLILPVKIKWLAMLQFLTFMLIFLSGQVDQQIMVAASLANYFLFFGREMLGSLTRINRRAKWASSQMQERRGATTARHRCAVCGIDSKSHPFEDFRYCSKCDGEHAYCEEHLHDHRHTGP